MKNFTLAPFLLCFALLAGCDDPDKGSPEITGEWVAFQVDGQRLGENDMFVNTFTERGKSAYHSRQAISATETKWIEEAAQNYSLSNGILTEEGYNYAGQHYKFISRVSISGEVMATEMLSHTLDGVSYPTFGTTLRKMVTSHLDLVGIWEGYETTPGANRDDFCWSFNANGTYDFYYVDGDTYVKKNDNQGVYFNYNDLLVFNFTNELLQGATGVQCDCWTVVKSGNRMNWDNGTRTFSMIRRENIPSTPQP